MSSPRSICRLICPAIRRYFGNVSSLLRTTSEFTGRKNGGIPGYYPSRPGYGGYRPVESAGSAVTQSEQKVDPMAVPNIGQNTARRLYFSATSGGEQPFELTEDVAADLAASCDILVSDLARARTEAAATTVASGFPSLPTGQALTIGFRNKGNELLDTLTALQETALLFKAAYLAASKRFADADAANKAAIELVSAHLNH